MHNVIGLADTEKYVSVLVQCQRAPTDLNLNNYIPSGYVGAC
jgi:hypothetical protein